jgi:Mce-associated membrane protein
VSANEAEELVEMTEPDELEETAAVAGTDSVGEPAGDDVGTGGADGATPVRSHGPRRWWRLALVVLALLVMVAGLGQWWRADHDSGRALAQQRDAVLIAATSHIETLNTLDYRKVADGLAAWQSVTTGTLHDQLAQVGGDEQKLLADQKKISTGKVVDAAVLSLSDDTATVLASVEVTVEDGLNPSAQPTVKRNRFSADMVEVHGQWLVENLEQVAVDIS